MALVVEIENKNMNAGLGLQYFIIALAVVLSGWVVLKKQFPNTTRRLRSTVARWLLRPQHSVTIQALGRRLATPTQPDSHCNGCDRCATPRSGQP